MLTFLGPALAIAEQLMTQANLGEPFQTQLGAQEQPLPSGVRPLVASFTIEREQLK